MIPQAPRWPWRPPWPAEWLGPTRLKNRSPKLDEKRIETLKSWNVRDVGERRTASVGLKRDLARQRARMGASGLNPNTGSAESVLLGLAADANRQTARDNYNFDMRRDAIQTGLARAQYQNLLQRRDAQTSMFMDLTRQGTGYLKPR